MKKVPHAVLGNDSMRCLNCGVETTIGMPVSIRMMTVRGTTPAPWNDPRTRPTSDQIREDIDRIARQDPNWKPLDMEDVPEVLRRGLDEPSRTGDK